MQFFGKTEAYRYLSQTAYTKHKILLKFALVKSFCSYLAFKYFLVFRFRFVNNSSAWPLIRRQKCHQRLLLHFHHQVKNKNKFNYTKMSPMENLPFKLIEHSRTNFTIITTVWGWKKLPANLHLPISESISSRRHGMHSFRANPSARFGLEDQWGDYG